jgi:hypothetical protein
VNNPRLPHRTRTHACRTRPGRGSGVGPGRSGL